MEIYIPNYSFNKVNTKEELVIMLKEYKWLLSNEGLDYLDKLIELDISVISDSINDVDRKVLSELEIYRKITIYNIYNRAYNLFKKLGNEFNIYGNEQKIEGLRVFTKINERDINLFSFDYKDKDMGKISLFQTIEDRRIIDVELDRVMGELESLYDEKNPFCSRRGTYGGPSSQWSFEHKSKIEKHEKLFEKLDKREITDEDKKEIEITRQVHDLLLNDFSLTRDSFVEEIAPKLYEDKNKLNKVLVKKMPNLTITDNIKYI